MLSAGTRAFGRKFLAFVTLALFEVGIVAGVLYGASALANWVFGADTSVAIGRRPDAAALGNVVLTVAAVLILLAVLWFTAQRVEMALDAVAGRRFGNLRSLRVLPVFVMWSGVVFAPLVVVLVARESFVGVAGLVGTVTETLTDPAGGFLAAITLDRSIPLLVSVVWIGILGFGPLAVLDGKGNPVGRNFGLIRSFPVAYAGAVAFTMGAVWLVGTGWVHALDRVDISLPRESLFVNLPAALIHESEWVALGVTVFFLVAIQLVYDFVLCCLAVAHRSRFPVSSGRMDALAAGVDLEVAAHTDPLSVTAPLIGAAPSYGTRGDWQPVWVTSPSPHLAQPASTTNSTGHPLPPPPTPPTPPRPPTPPVGQ